MTFLFNATEAECVTVRQNALSGIDARIQWEKLNKSDDSVAQRQIVNKLATHAAFVMKLDHSTLAFIARNPTLFFSESEENDTGRVIDFHQIFTSQRRGNQCFNEKAIRKLFVVSRVLNGSTFFDTSDDETTMNVVLMLGKGIFAGKELSFGLDDLMSAVREKRYTAGGTQSSSSLRALEALGVVSKVNGRTWRIADANRFQRLLDGANGLTANVAHQTPTPSVSPAEEASAVSFILDYDVNALLTYDPQPEPHISFTNEDASDYLGQMLELGIDKETALQIVNATTVGTVYA